MVHLLEVMPLGNRLEFDLGLLGLEVAPTSLLLDFDFLRTRFFNIFLQLFKLGLLSNHEFVNGVIFETELPQGIRDLFLFFITCLPRRNKVIWFKQSVLIEVGLCLLQAIFSHHNTS
jgi:hypothetical protein